MHDRLNALLARLVLCGCLFALAAALIEPVPARGASPSTATSAHGLAASGAFTIGQTLSDGAQRATLAFDGLAFLTGSLGADSFFPPGKVADFWGFQYLRDNDPSGMGHSSAFLTSASYNMLTVLNADQRAQLKALAISQVAAINAYGYGRFVLMQAFRRALSGDVPANSPGLSLAAVRAYSADLYRLDGQISYERAQVMGGILQVLTPTQTAYLNTMVGQGMLTWPVVSEPAELKGLDPGVKTAIMTYAGDMFSWYAGSIEADVYFCPERQGTYFGSFYMKDAPAIGNPGYVIDPDLTANMGTAFLGTLTASQALSVTRLVAEQKPYLLSIVDRRRDIAAQLRQFMSGDSADSATVLALAGIYGELDGEIVYRHAARFAALDRTLSDAQRAQLTALRTQTLGDLSTPAGAYLYASAISMPSIANTDFLFSPPPLFLPLIRR